MKKIKLMLLMCITVIVSCFTILSGCSNTTQSKKVWIVGVNVPTNQTEGEIGALYLNTSTYDIYQKQEDSSWEKIGNIKGAQGEIGEDGKTPNIKINEQGYWVINGEVTEYKAGEKTEEMPAEYLTEKEYLYQVASYGSNYMPLQNTRMRIIFSKKMKAGTKITFLGDSFNYKVSVLEKYNTKSVLLEGNEVDSLWNVATGTLWQNNGTEYVLSQDCYPVLTVAKPNGTTVLTDDDLNKIHSLFKVEGLKVEDALEKTNKLSTQEYNAQASHWGSVNLQNVDTRQRITFSIKMKKGTKVTFLGDTSIYKWACSEKCDNSTTTTRMVDLGWNTSIGTQDNIEYTSFLDGAFLVLTIARHDSAPLTEQEFLNIHSMFKVEGEKFENIETIQQLKYNVDTVAHRGFSLLAPENTLEAYRLAAKLGFTKAECDICFTSDGVPVLLHDGTIDRTSNGSGNIETMTLEQARTYDYGSWMGKEFVGTQIPTFEEFIALCRKINIHPYIELKGAVSVERGKVMVDIVKKYGMLDNVTWISFDVNSLSSIVQQDDTARVGLAYANEGDFQKALTLRTGKNEVFVTKEYRTITEDIVNECMAEGVQILAWTINSPTDVIALNPYVREVLSDWVNVGEVLKNSEI